MDAYETLWRTRAQEHGITDVGWYAFLDDDYIRHHSMEAAEQRVLEAWGDWRPSCGRGVNCSDIAPFLGGYDANGYFSSVEALLDGEYDDEEG